MAFSWGMEGRPQPPAIAADLDDFEDYLGCCRSWNDADPLSKLFLNMCCLLAVDGTIRRVPAVEIEGWSFGRFENASNYLNRLTTG